MAIETLVAARVEVGRVKQTTGRLTVVLPYLQQRCYIFTYPGTMFELQYSDIDMSYVRSARHLHVSSFFLHRSSFIVRRILDLFRLSSGEGGRNVNFSRYERRSREQMGTGFAGRSQARRYFFPPNDREAKKAARTEDLSQAINSCERACLSC